MTIGLQLCRWYYQEIGAWKCVSADFVYFHQFFSLFLTYSLSKTLKKWMTLNKVLLVRVIHMTKQFWDKIGRFDADKYAENVLKLECYKSVHAVVFKKSLACRFTTWGLKVLGFLLFTEWFCSTHVKSATASFNMNIYFLCKMKIGQWILVCPVDIE